MATINLGAIKFNWKGAYNSSTTYAVDDVVSSGGNSYVCIQAHSTTQAVGNATAYWNIMSEKGTNGTNGTNGTDLTSTLTTQGDILYRDGSGLARLGYGTAGQVLKTGGSGANPSWGTLSSDCVKLAYLEGDAVNVTGVDVTGYFNDTLYHSYKFEISDLQWTGNAQPMFVFLNSGGQINSGNYLVLHTGYSQSSGSSGGQQDRRYWNNGNIQDLDGTWNSRQNAGDYDYATMQGTIYNPQSTSVGKKMDYQYNSMSIQGAVQVVANGSFYHHSNSAVTGFRIRGHANNVRRYKMSLYGMKK